MIVHFFTRPVRLAGAALLAGALAACGGGRDAASTDLASNTADTHRLATAVEAPAGKMSQQEAVRLAHQATFGPSEALVAELKATTRARWVQAQMNLPASRYTAGGSTSTHSPTGGDYCNLSPQKASPTCWRDNFSIDPLLWDFYRNASFQPDQLRQRVAFALSQLIVVNTTQSNGTYGYKRHYNQQLDLAFGNYRDVLRQMTLSPIMGKFLDNVNNNKASPNENYAREMMQLFSLGPCQLNADGSLLGGSCKPTYDNNTVREYAYALTGWTYPVGGLVGYLCGGSSPNCEAYDGDMTPFAPYHDTSRRQLLSSVVVPAGSTAPAALEAVLDSLMKHPNMAPFMAKRLIEKLVMSNPAPAYVRRVADAFTSGSYSADGVSFGAGKRGDLAATVAAVLLDRQARQATPDGNRAGHLREPMLLMVGALRALNGGSDSTSLHWIWDTSLQQMVFMAPSVFNFYPPEFPVAGTQLAGPEFGIHSTNAALVRLNYLNNIFLGSNAAPTKDSSIPGATGTYVRKSDYFSSVTNPGALVDRVANLLLGQPLAEPARGKVIDAINAYAAENTSEWREWRVGTAFYLVMASPDYQVQR